MKRKGRDATDGGDVLVLLADGLTEFVELDVAGLLGELGGGNQALLRRVEGLEQGGGEAARGAEAGAAGDIGHRGELEVGIGHAGEFQGLADDRMLDLVDVVGALEF